MRRATLRGMRRGCYGKEKGKRKEEAAAILERYVARKNGKACEYLMKDSMPITLPDIYRVKAIHDRLPRSFRILHRRIIGRRTRLELGALRGHNPITSG